MWNDSGSRLEQRRRQSGESSAPFLENPEYGYGEVQLRPGPYLENPREMCLSPSQWPYPKPLAVSAAHLPNPRVFPGMENPPDDYDLDPFEDTPEYEALCIADRERAESEALGPRNLHLRYKNRRKMPYSIDKDKPPRHRPTSENISPDWYAPPLPGLNCSICGSSEHNEGCCSYLYNFPPDGCLLNNYVYEVVCLCGRAIVEGSCPSGYCLPDRPMRVAAKLCEPFWRFGRKHMSRKELMPRHPTSIHNLSSVSPQECDGDLSFAQFLEKLNKRELVPLPWEKDVFEMYYPGIRLS